MNKIAVIGGGAWGCALASAILKKGYYPFILTSSTKRAKQINNEFLSRFKNLESRNELIAHSDPLKVFGNASIIILATLFIFLIVPTDVPPNFNTTIFMIK